MKKILFKYILPPVLFFITYLISLTLRIDYKNRQVEEEIIKSGKNRLYTLWHGRLFIFPFVFKKIPNMSVLVSPSGDGEIISRLLNLYGFATVRGSSFKKGREAFFNLLKSLKKDQSAVLIGDGSRGPKHIIQKGVVYLAKKTGLPIISMTFSAKNRKLFGTWDSFMIPYPFSKAVVIYSDPIYISKEDSIDEKCVKIQKNLDAIMKEADEYFDS